MNEIIVDSITKDFGHGRGIFDISFSIKKGEIFGFVGTNGSGKTTTIRNIMGFIRPDKGTVLVKDLDSWKKSFEIKKYVGYVPGEIAFPDIKTGKEFLLIQAKMLNLKNMDYANYLIKTLQLDTSAAIKTMSKGMKQKTAIINALMADPEILILDEPTTGLDPLMRNIFIDIIKQEKAKGKTIFMSSHIFEEIEDTCDRLALIKDGRIADIADINDIRNNNKRSFKIEFCNKEDFHSFINEKFQTSNAKEHYFQVTVDINSCDFAKFFASLGKYSVKFVSEIKYTLEKHFEKIFKGEIKK